MSRDVTNTWQVIRHIVAAEDQYHDLLVRAWAAAIVKPRTAGKGAGKGYAPKKSRVRGGHGQFFFFLRVCVVEYLGQVRLK